MKSLRHYCTHSDRNYLTRGIALCESMLRHEVHPHVIYYICLDEITHTVLKSIALPNVVPVPLHAVERGDDGLRVARSNRSLIEYFWTLTPTIIAWVLEAYPQIDTLTYLDADLFFYAAPDPVFDELAQGSVAIHEHRFAPELRHLEGENGRFNVGLMTFRRDLNGMAALHWWREQCLDWCYAVPEHGKMGDQKYLEAFPTSFAGVVILSHLGVGLAPWNQSQYDVQLRGDDAPPTVNGVPVIFYHFHALALPDGDVVVAAKHAYGLGEPILRACYLPYCEALSRAQARVKAIEPSLPLGVQRDLQVRPEHVLLVRRSALSQRPELASMIQGRRAVTMEGWDVCFAARGAEGLAPSAPASVPAPPTAAGGFGEELLVALHGLLITRKVQTLLVAGAHRFAHGPLLFQLFPKLKDVYLFEPQPELFAPLKQWENRDARIRVFPYALSDGNDVAAFHITNNDGQSSSLMPLAKHRQIFPDVVEVEHIRVERKTVERVMAFHDLSPPDMLFIDAQGAEYQILSSLPAEVLRGVQLIYTEASTEEVYRGGKTLDELKALLGDDFVFVDFAPLSPHTPTHGNALFVNKASTWLLKQG